LFQQSSVFKRLGIKQVSEPKASATFKRTIKGVASDAHYGPSIPTEESSAFTKRIKLEETSMKYFCKEIIVKNDVNLYFFDINCQYCNNMLNFSSPFHN